MTRFSIGCIARSTPEFYLTTYIDCITSQDTRQHLLLIASAGRKLLPSFNSNGRFLYNSHASFGYIHFPNNSIAYKRYGHCGVESFLREPLAAGCELV